MPASEDGGPLKHPHLRRSPRRSVLLVVAGVVLLLASVGALVLRPAGHTTGRPEAGAPGSSSSADPTTSDTPDPTGTPTATTSAPATTRPPGTKAPAVPVYSGFPSAANTGWRPTGVSLTASSMTSVTTAGATIDAKDLGCLSIKAANVTIKRSRIRCNDLFPVRVFTGANVTIVDSEIDGSGRVDASCITSERYVARRVDCHGVGDGMYVTGSNVTIEDSYIHDLVSCSSCHNDGIQVTSGISVVIRHNTIENRFDQTSCIKIGNEQGPVRDVLVEGNLLMGGGYALYAGGTGSDVSNMRYIANHFGKRFFPQSGSYGPVAYYVPSVPGNVWSGNVWDDNGAVVNPA